MNMSDSNATMEDVDLNRNRTSDQIVDLHVWAAAAGTLALTGIVPGNNMLALRPPPLVPPIPLPKQDPEPKRGTTHTRQNGKRTNNLGKNLDARTTGSLERHHRAQ